MSTQASSSSAPLDQRRQDALKGYREVSTTGGSIECMLTVVFKKMRQHEANSQSLKNCKQTQSGDSEMYT